MIIKDRFAKRQNIFGQIISILCPLSIAFCLFSCNPESPWTTKDVDITMEVTTISAGFVECHFSTNKDAYYLVAIQPVDPTYNPMTVQKQFMTLALDSANAEYLAWRNQLLKEGEFNVAPFASHALQYGSMNHFFTNLQPDTDYWIYAFVVNPDKMQPVGKLNLLPVHTSEESQLDIFFEYRVHGRWDYIYPVDSNGNIYSHLPYMSNVIDSLDIVATVPEEYRATVQVDTVAMTYFSEAYVNLMETGVDLSRILTYGVKVAEHDYLSDDVVFEEGHTYYTAIVAWDGVMGNNVIYKFKWTGEKYEAYFKNEDSFVYDW